MRIAVLTAMLAAVAGGQWLEATVELPDSLNAVSGIRCCVYCPETGEAYFGGSESDRLLVVDALTGAKATEIPVGQAPEALCLNPNENKVYCANQASNNVTVIDAQTHNVVATLPVGDEPIALCYNTHDNKVYCANSRGVTVIDGAADSVIITREVWIAGPLCYNPQDNKVYCASYEGLVVIDGATNSRITTINEVFPPWSLCYNPLENRIYCSTDWVNRVIVIDGAADTVVARVDLTQLANALCYDPQRNKVYCADELRDRLTVIDGATNQVLGSIGVGDYPIGLCCSPAQGRVYVANYRGSSVSVIRDTAVVGILNDEEFQTALGRPPTIIRGVLAFQPADGGSQHRATLLDITGRKVIDLVPGLNDIRHVAPGVYFVKPEEEDCTAKVVVQN